jgi:hypothetical protein
MLLAVLIIAILNTALLIYLIGALLYPEIEAEIESKGIMTPKGLVQHPKEKNSPVYNDDEKVWKMEQEREI